MPLRQDRSQHLRRLRGLQKKKPMGQVIQIDEARIFGRARHPRPHHRRAATSLPSASL
jgi:hypothetical protein